MTDIGVGGTDKSFHCKLAALNVTAVPEIYLVGYCTLHCIQLTLSSAVKHVLGEGGTQKNGQYKQNAMQLLHGLYNLQSKHERGEWTQIWKAAAL